MPSLAILTPTRVDQFPGYFVDSLWALRRSWPANFFHLAGRPVAFARNELVRTALEGPFTHLLWLDADMAVPPETFEHLLAMDVPIASGLYFSRTQTPIPHAYHWVREENGVHWYLPMAKEFAAWLHANPDEENEVDSHAFLPDVYEADSIGFGCVLIRREVFERVPAPWFVGNIDGGGEDFDFCRKAKAAGYQIWVDFGLQCEHEFTPWFSGRSSFAQCWGIGQPNEHDFQASPRLVREPVLA